MGVISISPDQRLWRGSHIKVYRSMYYHHGIYIGQRKVIHYNGLSNNLFDKGESGIASTSLEKFVLESQIEIVNYPPPPRYSRDKIIERAKERLEENAYDIFQNNCEHFATWCVTDKPVSKQITSTLIGGLTGLLFENRIEW